MNLNRAMIIGNATRDPEMRTTATGQAMATFGVATNRVYIDKNGQRQEEVEFHDIVAWGKLGEICGQYIRKGRKIYVEGRLNTRSWDDPAGFKRYRTQIIADNMILLDKPPDGAYQPYQGQAYQSGSMPRSAMAPQMPSQNFEPVPQQPASLNKPAPSVPVEELPIIQTEEINITESSVVTESENSNSGEEEVSVEDLPF